MAQPTLFTIPPSRSFVDALASGIRSQISENPTELARYRILLPTRRSCRGLREAFLRLSGGKPTLLPRMMPIGDIDEDELLLSGQRATETINENTAFALPPAVSGLRRQLLLAEMIRRRPSQPSADQAALLAHEMGRLIDQVDTEGLDFSALKNLDVGDYAEHWNQTLEFLNLVIEFWPDILSSEGVLDPADHRNRLLTAQAAEWASSPPDTPVIAAGSTGSIPATAQLLNVIARMESGCVVLPGLDRELSDEAWDALGPTHPQYGLKHLLEIIGISRTDVPDWPSHGKPDEESAPLSRAALLRTALLPSTVTGTRPSPENIPTDALEGVTRIDCADTAREAECIALIMRETLETPGKTAALVTPDRALARRVALELRRWNIEIDDSAGVPLSQTPPGTFLQLSAEMVVGRLAPISLLATLKHPLAGCGYSPKTLRRLTRRLEKSALRGPRPEECFSGLLSILKASGAAEEADFVTVLADMASGFVQCTDAASVETRSILRAHLAFAERLAKTDETDGSERLWAGDAGEMLAQFVAELHDALDESMIITPNEYPVLLKTLIRHRVVRPRYGKHPRLGILGPLEARLRHADHMILGGLNEGVWPPEPPTSPWMSRPMMTAFGLPLPERRIGLSAHDFAQAFSAKAVTVTRSERTDGVPTVPSRWLRRIENLVSATEPESPFRPNEYWLQLAMELDKPAHIVKTEPPAPTPPIHARPRSLSVTQIRTLQRDPYAIYARHILKLKPLDTIDSNPGAAERGIIIHDILDRFIKQFPDHLPENAKQYLIAMGQEEFAEHINHPGVRAFWWPRFERIADWFVEHEQTSRRGGEQPVISEACGQAVFGAPGGDFTLTARADRINSLPGGGLALVDYKTGQIPSCKQAKIGLEPQLPLEAAIIKYGSFEGVPRDDVRQLSYIRLTGGPTPGEVRHLKLDVEQSLEDAWAGLQNLIAEYDNPAQPYLSHVRPLKQNEIGDYGHLARVGEWLSTEDDQ